MIVSAKIRIESNLDGKYPASWSIEKDGEEIFAPDSVPFFDTEDEAEREARRQIHQWITNALNSENPEITIFVKRN